MTEMIYALFAMVICAIILIVYDVPHKLIAFLMMAIGLVLGIMVGVSIR